MAASGPPFFGTVYADQYGSIQAAIVAAGNNGSVIIPATYSGSDSYANPRGIQIQDLRPGKIALNSATGAATPPPKGMWWVGAVNPSYGSTSVKSPYAGGACLFGAVTSPGPLGQ